MIYLGALLVFMVGYFAGNRDRKARQIDAPDLTLSEEWAAKQLRH